MHEAIWCEQGKLYGGHWTCAGSLHRPPWDWCQGCRERKIAEACERYATGSYDMETLDLKLDEAIGLHYRPWLNSWGETLRPPAA